MISSKYRLHVGKMLQVFRLNVYPHHRIEYLLMFSFCLIFLTFIKIILFSRHIYTFNAGFGVLSAIGSAQ